MQKKQFVISTDLDGTLLDHYDYSWKAAAAALAHVAKHKIPVVINTSKTRQEVFLLQQGLTIHDPFIVENGSAIYLHPTDNRFDQQALGRVSFMPDVFLNEAVLGTPRQEILESLEIAREQFKWSFTGFNDMSEAEIVEITNLSPEKASSAKNRQFSEPLLWQDTDENLDNFKQYLSKQDLTLLQGGRFYHVLGDTNKGRAIQWLLQRSITEQTSKLIALGDSNNDLDMLKIADYAVLVKSPTHGYPQLDHARVTKTEGEGPLGWNQAILELIDL